MSVEGVILAAGFSKRAGCSKMELEIEGKSILERCISGMYEACSKIIVVGGYRFENINKLVNMYEKVKIIYNPDYEMGMFNSIKAGIKYIGGERFFLIPGDYPFVKAQIYEEMLYYNDDIVIPEYNGKRGHPILIKSKFITEILNNKSFTSLRDFKLLHSSTAIEVNDEGILVDIDTMEDYIKYNRVGGYTS